MQRILRDLTAFYLIVLLLVWIGIGLASDRWWPGTLISFSPRWMAAVPIAVLLPATLLLHVRLAPLFLVHALVVVGPIMGFSPIGIFASPSERTADWLRVITVNTGGHTFESDQLIDLIRNEQADAVCLQECEAINADHIFRQLGWHVRREGLLIIGSRWELGEAEVLARHFPDEHNVMAMACPMRWNNETVMIVNVHLPTPRPGIQAMWSNGIQNCDELSMLIEYRRTASTDVKAAIDELVGPRVVMGDFNMPVDSRIYRDCWSDLQNAFSVRGWGFGYTKFTRWHGIRIDHVLADDNWQPQTAIVGGDLRGDHRPVVADIELIR